MHQRAPDAAARCRPAGAGRGTGVTRVYVPADSAAIAAGADPVAKAVGEAAASGLYGPIEIVRTGSRGMAWLEPLMEIETPAGRIGYGPLLATEVPGALAAALESPPAEADPGHPKSIGIVDAHPWIARQTRLTFARCGIVDPGSLRDYCAHRGLRGLYRAIEIGPEATIDEIVRSGLRGRGRAALPIGEGWRALADVADGPRVIVCEAAARDRAAFADGMLLEGDPFALIEGMMIAGFALGAPHGVVHVGAADRRAGVRFAAALDSARAAGLLGRGALGAGFSFDIAVRTGTEADADALPGGRRHSIGLLTLAAVAAILADGAARFTALGTGRSRGTMPIQIAGAVRRSGLFETGFGLTLGELVEEIGGGTASGREPRAVRCGGPLGAFLPRSLYATRYDHDALEAHDGLVGRGEFQVFGDGDDLAQEARSGLQFCAAAGCGCTPCRVGSRRAIEMMDRIVAGDDRARSIERLEDLCQTMAFGSRCAEGRQASALVRSALRHFPQDFGAAPRRLAAE